MGHGLRRSLTRVTDKSAVFYDPSEGVTQTVEGEQVGLSDTQLANIQESGITEQDWSEVSALTPAEVAGVRESPSILFSAGSNTRGWSKVVSTINALSQGTVSQPVILQLGDSVAAYVSSPLITRLSRALTQVGWIFSQTAISTTTGTVTSVTGDWTYWINGTHTLIASAGSATWKTLGAQYFIANKAYVFLADQSAGGSATVTAYSAAGVVLATQTVSTTAATIAPRVVTLTWTTAQTSYVTVAAADGSVVVVGVAAINTSLAGFVFGSVGVGGISLVQMNSAPAAMLTAVMATLTPALVTYSMREVSNDAEHLADPEIWITSATQGLPKLLATADAGYASPWLCIAPTSAAIDAGFTKTLAPAHREAMALKGVAAAYGLAFFNSWDALGSWEDITARANSGNDGIHIGAVEQQLLAQKFFDAANLQAMYAVPFSQNISTVYTYSYRYYVKKDEVTLGQANNWIGASGDGVDTQIGLYRWLDVVHGSSGVRALRVSTGGGPDGGAGVIMASGALVSNSNYYTTDGQFGFLVNATTGVVTLYGRVGGTLKSLVIGTLV